MKMSTIDSAVAGTPNEDSWPGIQTNEDFLSYRFDNYAPQSLMHRAPRLDGDGLDLLNKFLCVRFNLVPFLFLPSSSACRSLSCQVFT